MLGAVDLEVVLRGMDIAGANLSKLETVWERAEPMIPTSPSRGSSNEYEDLVRTWSSLLEGLPEIHGWTVTAQLPDADEVGQHFLDLAEIGEPPFDLIRQNEEPGRQLRDYRFRLSKARRKAVRTRLEELTSRVNGLVPRIVADTVPSPLDRVESDDIEEVEGGDPRDRQTPGRLR